MSTKALKITKNDLQPYYHATAEDSNGVIDITGATIVCTMKNIRTGDLKINRQSAGINISDATNGEFEYKWVSGDTDTVGGYEIEFEITPTSGGKFTYPTTEEDGKAIVEIVDSLDTT
jgi:hypothetical protein